MTQEEELAREIAPVIKAAIANAIAPLEAQIRDTNKDVAELVKKIMALDDSGLKYSGVYQRPQSYRRGAAVTHAGALWIAATDAVPGEIPGKGGPWQLAVKSGMF